MDGTLSKLAVVITAKTDSFSKGVDSASNKVNAMGKQMKIAAAAITALGVAGLKLVADARKMNAELGVTALNLGITTKEMRDLALAVTNVTFPLGEVTKTFDLLARAGVKDQQVLKDTALAFDTLGDAIGVPASQVTEKLIPTMKTFNLSAEEMAGKTDSLTYLFRNTTVSLDDFNRMVGYATPDLVAMGLTTEDMIAILAELEEQGYSGEVMTREFRKAVTSATKEQIPLNEALGISTETIGAYKEELKGAEGITQEYANVANEQYGIMDKIKQKWSELALVAGSFLTPLEPILGAMTALGPMMFFFSTGMGTAAIKTAAHTVALIAHKIALLALAIATKAAAAAQWLLNVAMSANPIGLVILAIAGIIAIIVLLIKHFDKVKAVFAAVGKFIVDKFKAVVNFFKSIPAAIKAVFWKVADFILAPIRFVVNKIIDAINWVIRLFNKLPGVNIGVNIGEIGGKIPKFSEAVAMQYGGIVTKPTLAVLGERGPEAVVPLGTGMAGTIVNVTVQGSVWAEQDLAEAIRNQLLLVKDRNVNVGL